jgi:ribonucleoside-diphosphate reductase alpha chain
MQLNTEILSDLTVYSKYAKYLPEKKRREVWDETVDRNMFMHIDRFPQLKKEIYHVYENYVRNRKVLPSMRSLQFAGKAIRYNPSRIFNCAYLPIDDYRSFPEVMFLLLGGTGVGYSVQRHHVDKLPEIRKPLRSRRFLINDSIEGWADSIKVLMKSYFGMSSKPRFDYSDIRPKGAPLKTAGGKAPGPDPLRECHFKIEQLLERKQDGEKLTPLEVHDIICYIASAVLAGGIRRSALISLFSFDDAEMRACKTGDWESLNPQRRTANNSAVALRHRLTREDFFSLFEQARASNHGEPGIYLTNNAEWGANPCVEIGLRPNQFCNLTTINVSDLEDQEDFNQRASAAAFIGTLQASYTDFHYLREIWQRNTEKDALIGVSMTGIASNRLFDLDIEEAVSHVKRTNSEISAIIGINPAARTTCVKPEGSSSLVFGTSSGVHPWHSPYYIRRMRLLKNEAIYQYLAEHHPELVEDEFFDPTKTAVISIPVKAPEGATDRSESALQFLQRVKDVYTKWVKPGHRDGDNTHNVSATAHIDSYRIYSKETMIAIANGEYKEIAVDETGEYNEWDVVAAWMWKNRDVYNGLTILPSTGSNYKQMPFEECDEETYNRLSTTLRNVDLSKIVEEEDTTKLEQELACAGGSCEIT